jgi:uncharacterized membrane protein (DUF4010 family)
VDLVDIFLRLGIALGLGLLIGLQRERTREALAGFRTFPLVCAAGLVLGLLSLSFGGWVLAAGLLALAAVVVIGNLAMIQAGNPSPGLTTEMAVLLMFSLGAYLSVGPPQVAVVLGGAVAVLLHFKTELHGLAARIGDADFRAVMQFVVISLIVLPVLPDQTYGPYQVLNPREIWWMVVLIVALSFAGYVGLKLLQGRAGTILGGALGGLVSSTATTLTFARRTRNGDAPDLLAARVIQIAAAVAYLRVLVAMGVVAPHLLPRAVPPLLAMMGVLALLTVVGWRRSHRGEHEMPRHGNPTELRTALLFGALYAGVLLAVAWAKEHFGSSGLYTVAGLSGLVDLNAITLSTAQLSRTGQVADDLVWRLVLFASLTNLGFKAVLIGLWGSLGLLRRMTLLWGLAAVVGLLILAFWPGGASLGAQLTPLGR